MARDVVWWARLGPFGYSGCEISCVRKGSESRSLRNRPVSAINRNRAGRDLAVLVVNSLGRLTSRPPVLCRNFCLAS